ncbi:MAG: methylaspartate mutase subunit S [Defluviitaleaceae bacterium]|nr:methylaspartate mutase subunit S [Defluviitaleaceae bacterium]
MNGLTMVLGVIGADVHAVGNKILNHIFTEAGFKVINLGSMVTQKEFVEAAVETNAHMILVSSLYGHGEIDCKGLREKCNEAGLENIKLYVGGNLVVGKTDFKEVEEKFLAMGFDRVYPPGVDPEISIGHIYEDFDVKKS